MLNKNFFLSIIIPTLNSSKTILRTLKSVNNQNYQHYEIIIIDSFSSDNTILKIRSLQNPKIKIFFTNKKKGLAYARYFGILKSKGRYVAFLDSDDEWLPGKIHKQMEFMSTRRSVFSCTNYQLQNNKSTKKIFISKNKIFYKDLLIDRPIVLSSVVILKNILIKIAKNYHSNSYAEDYMWWIMILKKKYHCDVIKLNLTVVNIVKNSRSIKIFRNYLALLNIYNKNLKISFGRIFIIFMLLIYNTFGKNIFKYKKLFFR
jgi:teichuronic acid biosynthesis glycosyltransferase TuaG